MQVFGLPSHGRAASRLPAAKASTIEAAKRRDAVQRWRGAIVARLTAEQAAKAVGIPRPTLYPWERRSEPLSRRPHRPRGKQWTHELVRAVEDCINERGGEVTRKRLRRGQMLTLFLLAHRHVWLAWRPVQRHITGRAS